MAILIMTAALVVVVMAGIYRSTTRPCQSGWHHHRHWRYHVGSARRVRSH